MLLGVRQPLFGWILFDELMENKEIVTAVARQLVMSIVALTSQNKRHYHLRRLLQLIGVCMGISRSSVNRYSLRALSE